MTATAPWPSPERSPSRHPASRPAPSRLTWPGRSPCPTTSRSNIQRAGSRYGSNRTPDKRSRSPVFSAPPASFLKARFSRDGHTCHGKWRWPVNKGENSMRIKTGDLHTTPREPKKFIRLFISRSWSARDRHPGRPFLAGCRSGVEAAGRRLRQGRQDDDRSRCLLHHRQRHHHPRRTREIGKTLVKSMGLFYA